MGRKPCYTLEQIIDLFQLEIPMLRPKDLTKNRNSWCSYLGYDAAKKRAIRLYAPGSLTRQEAFQQMQPRILAYLQGRLPHMVTFEGYAKKWLSSLTCKPITKYTYTATINKHLFPYFGGMKLKDITPTEVRQYLIQKQTEGKIKAKTINEQLGLLKSLFKAAHEDELIYRNPLSSIRKLPYVPKPIEAFTEQEVRAILETCKVFRPRFYPVILHAFATGERMGEIFAHQWEDIEGDRIKVARTVKVKRVSTPKNGKVRYVHLPEKLRKAIKAASARYSPLKSKILYCNKFGDYLDHNGFRKKCWVPLLERAGVPYKNFHVTRHTFASLHLKHGTSLEWISKQLGHHSLSFTFATYVHFLPKADADAGERLMAVIGGN